MPDTSVGSRIQKSQLFFVDHDLRHGHCDGVGPTLESPLSREQTDFDPNHAICQMGEPNLDIAVGSDIHLFGLYHAIDYSIARLD